MGALARFHESQQESTRTGIDHEESLLHESAMRESSLNTQVVNMEVELKQAKAEVQRLRTEKQRIEEEYNDLNKTKDVTTGEVRQMKYDLKDFKLREARMLLDFTELEEENINLQKQVSALRTAQIEFEGSKHEIRHLQEEVDVFKHQVEELTNLKRIAEKQLEESLESLQAEREQRYNLKKEMDMKMNSDNMIQMGNLMRGLGGGDDMGKDNLANATNQGALASKEESLENMDEDQRSSGPTSDLFSEIHLNELQKLEKQLESIETEKLQVTKNLHETKESLDRMKSDLASQITCISQIKLHTESLDRLQTEVDQQNNNLDNRKLELAKIKVCVQEMEESVKSASSAVSSDTGDSSVDVMVKLKTDMISLRGDISTAEQKSTELHHDMRILEKLSSDSLRALMASQREVFAVQHDIAKMYERVCEANHTTPHKIMTLDHIKSGGIKEASATNEAPNEDQVDKANERKNSSNTSTLISKLRSSN